jgi:hypothetical protein
VWTGRAAILAVVFLAIIYTMSEVGLQGVVSPARRQANSDPALVYVARATGGGGWEKVMALALALSVIASTGILPILACVFLGWILAKSFLAAPRRGSGR